MSGLNASLGLSQIKKINIILKKKRLINKIYHKNFSNLKNVYFLGNKTNSKCNFWLNNIYVDKISLKDRNILIKKLNKKNISVRPIWKLMHKVRHLKKYQKMNVYNSIKLEKGIISLPSSPKLI